MVRVRFCEGWIVRDSFGFRTNGLFKQIGEENIFPAEANPTILTRRDIIRARQLLSGKADVRLFYEHPMIAGENDERDYEI